jgi:hypothetical protein
VERTYSFGIEKLLYEWYAVCGRLSTPSGGASEDVAVFEGKGDRLLLDSSWTREAEVCEGTEDKGGNEIRKRCECVQLGLLRLRFSHLLSTTVILSVNSKMKDCKLGHVIQFFPQIVGTSRLDSGAQSAQKCIAARTASSCLSTKKGRCKT